VAPGNYTLSGFAHPVVGEEVVFDNYMVGGEVAVLPSGDVLHDLVVVDVVAWPSVVEVGDDVFVDVVVRNNGSVVEAFNVTVYFDGVEISTALVSSLVSGGEVTVGFVWDTSGVAPGN
jgi:subtilase family serine protease